VIVVAGVTNLQFSVPVDGFPVSYVPVRYPQGQTGVRVAGVGYNVAAGLTALGSEVRLATFAGGDLLGGAVETELRARGLYGPWVVGGQETPRSVVLHEPGRERMICTLHARLRRDRRPARRHHAGGRVRRIRGRR
jgi:sugar/nucleoside kinase (ribokinase family)